MTVPLKVILQDGRVKLDQTVTLPTSAANPLVIPIGYIGKLVITAHVLDSLRNGYEWFIEFFSRLSASYTAVDVYCKYQDSVDGGTPVIRDSTNPKFNSIYGGTAREPATTTIHTYTPLDITVTYTSQVVARFVTHTTSGGDCRFVTSGASFVNSL